jgi:hypothetical protein
MEGDIRVRRIHETTNKTNLGIGVTAMALLSLLLGGATRGSAQGPAQGGVNPATSGCAVTFSNAGPPLMSACVSWHGNISSLRYSPSGATDQHISVGSVLEGYCLLDNATGTTYFDNGIAEARWGVATQSSTATTVSTSRTTTDGNYTLTQNVFFKYGSRLVLVGNVVKNNDTVSHSITFDRSADLDINGTSGSDTFDVIGGSVLARETDGVALTSLSNLVGGKGVETFANFVSNSQSCSHTFQSPPYTGDGAAVIFHIATIAPGASTTFRVGYRFL